MISIGEDVENRVSLYTVAGTVKCCGHYGNSMEVPKKLRLEPVYYPVILLLDIHSEELKSGS